MLFWACFNSLAVKVGQGNEMILTVWYSWGLIYYSHLFIRFFSSVYLAIPFASLRGSLTASTI